MGEESKTESKFEPKTESVATKPTVDQKSPYDSGLSSYGQKSEDRRPSFGQSLISKPEQKPSFDQQIASNPKSTFDQKPTFNSVPAFSSPPKPAKRTSKSKPKEEDEH